MKTFSLYDGSTSLAGIAIDFAQDRIDRTLRNIRQISGNSDTVKRLRSRFAARTLRSAVEQLNAAISILEADGET